MRNGVALEALPAAPAATDAERELLEAYIALELHKKKQPPRLAPGNAWYWWQKAELPLRDRLNRIRDVVLSKREEQGKETDANSD